MLDVLLTRNPEFRPLGRFALVAVDSGLRPETPVQSGEPYGYDELSM
jgi:hypothetical protein